MFVFLCLNQIIIFSEWKAMSVNPRITERERTKLATWTYPVPITFTNLFEDVNNNEDFAYPADLDEVVFKVTNGTRKAQTQFAFFGEIERCPKPFCND